MFSIVTADQIKSHKSSSASFAASFPQFPQLSAWIHPGVWLQQLRAYKAHSSYNNKKSSHNSPRDTRGSCELVDDDDVRSLCVAIPTVVVVVVTPIILGSVSSTFDVCPPLDLGRVGCIGSRSRKSTARQNDPSPTAQDYASLTGFVPSTTTTTTTCSRSSSSTECNA